MEQLSSCYFCGGALDASLDEYPVIPRSLHPDPEDQQTVVLCQGCRRKLGNVVESVVAAVEAEATPDAGESSVSTDSRDEPETAPSSDRADSGAGADGPSSVDGDVTEPADSHTTHSSTNESPSTSTTDESPSTAHSPGTNGSEATAEETDTGARPDDGDDAGNADDASSEYGTSTAAGETKTPAGDDGPSLSALEYNRVMRLVQNREFPIDRAEIRTVAVNAYEISESEFDAVIDAAVSRGLIAEENGQFVEGS